MTEVQHSDIPLWDQTWCGCTVVETGYHALGCPISKQLRQRWTSPQWISDLIGERDLDPCSNPRSKVVAHIRLMLEQGDDGLREDLGPGGFHEANNPTKGYVESRAKEDWETFINPPHGPGQVLRWVRHYRHTRFIYLLRWDPSTDWFAELHPHCTHIWHPARRVNYDPPPRIKPSSNAYPHALYVRKPNLELLDRLSSTGYLHTL